MRICLWHGWLLEGSGSNIYTARVAASLAADGHDVLLVCQEPHPERYPWISAWGTVGPAGPSPLAPDGAAPGPGRCVLLRPEIGALLPVFVIDEYEGFQVKRFLDLTDEELEGYLRRNADALRAAAAWHGSEVVITGHAIPGGEIGRRALGPGRYVTKIHGSDIEYAIRPQARYRALAREGLGAARAVAGASSDALARCAELVPGIETLQRVVSPGVDVEGFRPAPRRESLLDTSARLGTDPDLSRGRPASLDAEIERALAARDPDALSRAALTYDQTVPDADANARLRALAEAPTPIVGYFGKFIPQKGVELAIGAARVAETRPATLVVGFGLHREWLSALVLALRTNDGAAVEWLGGAGGVPIGLAPEDLEGVAPPVVFTGRLDHRYAPGAIAAMDVLVVPSILEEAFGMVAAEGAAAGALPLVARHSGLAEVAGALESEVGRPGLFSFEPGNGAVWRIAAGMDRLLALPRGERDELRRAIRSFVTREWSWRRTAERLLDAAGA
jgi:glycosyltransferase involved in cell wall biosynthesis